MLLEIEEKPLQAYNLTVDNSRTFFISGDEKADPVWVHNCYDKLANRLGNMSGGEYDRLSANWDKSTFESLSDSLIYHADKHWGGDISSYLRSASSFSTRGARRRNLIDGAVRYEKNGYFAIYRNSRMVSYGRN